MIGECAICGKETLLVEHHVSYKENRKVHLCIDCHNKVHADPTYFPRYTAVDTKKVGGLFSDKTRPAYIAWLKEQKERKRDKWKARMEEAELELRVIRKMRMGVL